MRLIKRASIFLIKNISKVILISLSFFCLLIHPEEIGQGVRDGLALLGENIIPSLFPFMTFATYVAHSSFITRGSKVINRISQSIFNVSGTGLTGVFLGILGGYPIGAKIVADFYTSKAITKSETQKLFCWCVNPSPAFVITAIGTFMLKNTQSGIILYVSVILASATLGIFIGTLSPKDYSMIQPITPIKENDVFVNSVASSSKSMLSICAWVIIFSAASKGLDCMVTGKLFTLFIKSVAEVTIGCKTVIMNAFPLPVLSAILGFGGFAVIFQVAPYLEQCKYKLKYFICWRIVTGAISAFYCSVLIKLFPRTTQVFQVIEAGNTDFYFSHSTIATVFLILTCLVLILEVDNKKKMC